MFVQVPIRMGAGLRLVYSIDLLPVVELHAYIYACAREFTLSYIVRVRVLFSCTAVWTTFACTGRDACVCTPVDDRGAELARERASERARVHVYNRNSSCLEIYRSIEI